MGYREPKNIYLLSNHCQNLKSNKMIFSLTNIQRIQLGNTESWKNGNLNAAVYNLKGVSFNLSPSILRAPKWHTESPKIKIQLRYTEISKKDIWRHILGYKDII